MGLYQKSKLVCVKGQHQEHEINSHTAEENICKPKGPVISVLGIYPRKMKAFVHMETCIQMFTVALPVRGKKWEQPRSVPASCWVSKQSMCIHTVRLTQPPKRKYRYTHNADEPRKRDLHERSQSQELTYCTDCTHEKHAAQANPETETGSVLPGTWGGEEGNHCQQVCGFLR